MKSLKIKILTCKWPKLGHSNLKSPVICLDLTDSSFKGARVQGTQSGVPITGLREVGSAGEQAGWPLPLFGCRAGTAEHVVLAAIH